MSYIPCPILIGNRAVDHGQPCFVIAEAGVNHNGSVEVARRLIHAARDAGADAVKFQTFNAAAFVSRHAQTADYQKRHGSSQLDMLTELELPIDAWKELKKVAEDAGLIFLSTPFDTASARLLREIGIVAFKVGSGDLNNIPLLKELAGYELPIILSTGMSHMREVDYAIHMINEVKPTRRHETAILHCVSSYPAPADQSNLRVLTEMQTIYMHRKAVMGNHPVGYSDHSLGWEIAVAAVAMGACIIEKHLTIDNAMNGPDHAMSLSPAQFKQMVSHIRSVQSAMGDGTKVPMLCELENRKIARRSLVAASDLPVGHVIAADDIAIKRPGTGIDPGLANHLIGRKITNPIQADELFGWRHIA